MMKITFLGTGTSQGVPLIGCSCKVCKSVNNKDKRLRSSVLIEIGNKTFVIDTGPDFRQQMLREKVKDLTAVLITHEHIDHIGGLDEVRAFNYILKKPIEVYASKNVAAAIKKTFSYIFNNSGYPGLPKINLHPITGKPFKIKGVSVIPVQVFHCRLPVYGFRIGDFTYITDANHIPEREMKKIIGSKVIVLNALRRKKHVSHFTLYQAIKLLRYLRPKHAFLTHISHQMGLHNDVERELPSFIRPAYDGLQLRL